MPKVSVIVPVYREDHLMSWLKGEMKKVDTCDVEWIVVDGDEAHPSLRECPEGVHLLFSEKGRGEQLRIGANFAKGETFLFLHADTQLPESWVRDVAEALDVYDAGAFALKISARGLWFRMIEKAATLRSKLTKIPFGDQAIFMRRETYLSVDGIRPFKLMEDVDLMKRLRKKGARIGVLSESVHTSARRWERRGRLKTTLRNIWYQCLFAVGVSPDTLYHWYYRPQESSVVIVMAKYPEAGRVKTRLAKDIGPDNAASLYAGFIRETLTLAASCFDKVLLFVSEQSECDRFSETFLSGDKVYFQRKGDLGDRLSGAFQEVFETKVPSAVLIGTDSPDLPQAYLQDARDALRQSEVVIGPTMDGGYYLIGFKRERFSEAVFQDIEWSTSVVFEQTLEKIKQEGLSVRILPKWWDIDTLEDLTHYQKRKGEKKL